MIAQIDALAHQPPDCLFKKMPETFYPLTGEDYSVMQPDDTRIVVCPIGGGVVTIKYVILKNGEEAYRMKCDKCDLDDYFA